MLEVASEAPQIVSVRQTEHLEENQRFIVLCAIRKGSLPISFSWRKDNVPIIPSDQVQIMHNSDYQETLEIERLTSEHVGNYTCSAKNLHGSDQISVPVVIKFKPRWNLSEDIKVISGVAGKATDVDCTALGHPKPTIKIFKGIFCLHLMKMYWLKNAYII